VFHYRSPDQRDSMPRNSDIGGHHVALYVDDLDVAIDHLRGHGIEVLDGPTASRGPAEGNRWIYFVTPWGMQFELVSYPGGKAFDRARRAGAAP
jgi:glyoxylase I family protein